MLHWLIIGMNRTDPQALKKTWSWDSPSSSAMSR